jgi:hypothetical protein
MHLVYSRAVYVVDFAFQFTVYVLMDSITFFGSTYTWSPIEGLEANLNIKTLEGNSKSRYLSQVDIKAKLQHTLSHYIGYNIEAFDIY